MEHNLNERRSKNKGRSKEYGPPIAFDLEEAVKNYQENQKKKTDDQMEVRREEDSEAEQEEREAEQEESEAEQDMIEPGLAGNLSQEDGQENEEQYDSYEISEQEWDSDGGQTHQDENFSQSIISPESPEIQAFINATNKVLEGTHALKNSLKKFFKISRSPSPQNQSSPQRQIEETKSEYSDQPSDPATQSPAQSPQFQGTQESQPSASPPSASSEEFDRFDILQYMPTPRLITDNQVNYNRFFRLNEKDTTGPVQDDLGPLPSCLKPKKISRQGHFLVDDIDQAIHKEESETKPKKTKKKRDQKKDRISGSSL